MVATVGWITPLWRDACDLSLKCPANSHSHSFRNLQFADTQPSVFLTLSCQLFVLVDLPLLYCAGYNGVDNGFLRFDHYRFRKAPFYAIDAIRRILREG